MLIPRALLQTQRIEHDRENTDLLGFLGLREAHSLAPPSVVHGPAASAASGSF